MGRLSGYKKFENNDRRAKDQEADSFKKVRQLLIITKIAYDHFFPYVKNKNYHELR